MLKPSRYYGNIANMVNGCNSNDNNLQVTLAPSQLQHKLNCCLKCRNFFKCFFFSQ
jgi:hypothetical protein